MTLNAIPGDRQLALAPLDEKADHVRGSPAAPLILEYGDYECPYSRQAFHAIEQVEQQLGGNVRFAFRHFPLTGIHPHALAAAAEAAALQGRFWDMHELLFHRQKALEDGDLRGYAARFGLDVAAFDRDRASTAVADRIRRDVQQRPGFGPGARHPHAVHRRRGAPRRLRPAHPAGRAGPMSRPARSPRSIRLAQLADTVTGCEDGLAMEPAHARLSAEDRFCDAPVA